MLSIKYLIVSLNLFRKLIPPLGGMVDVTPIIALLVLQFGVRLLINLF